MPACCMDARSVAQITVVQVSVANSKKKPDLAASFISLLVDGAAYFLDILLGTFLHVPIPELLYILLIPSASSS